MRRTGFVLVAGILFASVAAAQTQADAQAGAQAGGQTSAQAGKAQAQGSGSASAVSAASAQNGQTNASLGNGAAINAELTAPVDSKKAKPGDPVAARTTEPTKSNGKTVIPKGSKLVGHVTQASSRAKGDSESALGVVFDKAILKNGQEVPLNVAIQAIASAQSAATANAGNDLSAAGGAGAYAGGSGRAAGGGALGGVTSTAGGAAGTVTNTAANAGSTAGGALNSTTHSATNTVAGGKGAVGGLNAAGQLTSSSQGVFGLQGVNLSSATTGAAQGSLITCTGKNLHLDSGTQMLLVTQAAGSAETPKP
ncbi:MAG TPA: hypothetical protein VK728_16080 [Candidatus Sulfotelmatobacter sp.]|nr:hypothetical protein [Candidatus Sulfotelmatobacter sp.]